LDAPVPDLNLPASLDGVTALMGESIGTRERLILLTIDEIMKHGPSDFNARVVCDRLGVKQSMIPYHFESRDGLIAEATIWAYRDWSQYAVGVMLRTKGNAEKKLRAYLRAEIEWAARMGPVTLMTQYPLLSDPVRVILERRYGGEMRRKLEYHLVLLTYLVVDIRKGTATRIEFDESSYPGPELLLRHPAEFLTATSISWSSHGIGMWSSGSHLPSNAFGAVTIGSVSTKVAIEHHINLIVKAAEGR
jgi:AcrR family transcriptional regulator